MAGWLESPDEAAAAACARSLGEGKTPAALVVTGDAPPVPGATANGAGIRAWGIAWGLRELGLDARLIYPTEHRAPDMSPAPDWCVVLNRAAMAHLPTALARGSGAKGDLPVLVYQHWPLLSESGRAAIDYPGRIAVDLAGPHLLERRYWGGFNLLTSMSLKVLALARADYLMVGGHRQAAYFRALRAAAGAPIVPMHVADFALPTVAWSAPTDADSALRERLLGPVDRPLVLFCGLALPWQNPIWAMRRTLAALDRRGAGELLVVSPERAGAGLDASPEFQAFARELGEHPRAHRLGRMSFEAVLALCRSADVALDLYEPNPERGLAVPSRTAVYAATGLPVLLNAESEWAAVCGDHGPVDGAAVAWGDDAGFDATLERLLTRAPARHRSAEPTAAATAAFLGPERNLGPLRDWILAPSTPASRRSVSRKMMLDLADLHKLGATESAAEALNAAGTEAVARALEAAEPDAGPKAEAMGWKAPGEAVAAPTLSLREPVSSRVRRILGPMSAPLAAWWARGRARALLARLEKPPGRE